MDLPQPGMRLNSQPLLNTVPKLLTFDALFLQILAPFVRMLERDWYWGKDMQAAQSWISKDIWEQQSTGNLIDGTIKKWLPSWGSVGFTETILGRID